jgi:hypothetical protein
MKKIIISYSLFNQNHNESNAFTNDLNNNFWNNIPALIAVNLMVYPTASIWIYMPEEIIKNPLFEILEKLSEKFEALKIKFVSIAYQNDEPAFWKFKPVFDKLSEIVLCRDLNNIPDEMEIKSTQFFIDESNYHIQMIRTNSNQNLTYNELFSNFGGFKFLKINSFSKINFNEFYFKTLSEFGNSKHNSIIEFLSSDENWSKKHILNCINSKKQIEINKQKFHCKTIEYKKLTKKVNTSHVSDELFAILNELTSTDGNIDDFRGLKLEKLLEYNNLITFKLKKVLMDCSTFTQNFYLNKNLDNALQIG